MPRQAGEKFPTAGHVVDYLRAYEQRYELRVRRPVRVQRVWRAGERLAVETGDGSWLARCVISATGTWECPDVPEIPGPASATLVGAGRAAKATIADIASCLNG